eukprot:TRINITY_DN784_c0_g1_i1.p1 TRINITY_DN784_c0_g1~~TRINITY_DN784_c0_g1_i1.p1  ORF type:complete len:442 (+),score=146.87 TRINITY_DN784_c0_g1_i1:292-1617(+)
MSTKSELSLTESLSKTSIGSVDSESSATSAQSAPSSTTSASSDKKDDGKENREGLGKLLTKVLGADVTTITIPVSFCEPISFLMKLAEAIQYNDLLDKAAQCEDSLERLMYVSVFACSVWISTERQAKPFNPLLGETYEYLRPQNSNYKFFAEQVSHHPPIGACVAENDHWKFWQTQSLKTRFAGNSLECQGTGSSNVLLKKTGEHFKWDPVKTIIHNLIVGKIWIDNFGEINVNCKTTGEKAKIKMKECGWFSKNWRELEGDILDKEGKVGMHIFGKYNESIFVAQGEDSKDAKKDDKNARKKKFKDLKSSQHNETVWTHTAKSLPANKIPSKYANDFTEYTMDLIRLDDNMKAILPPGDSRFRSDRLALEKGDTKTASNEKNALEERQREARKKREKDGTTWVPKYFKLKKDEDGQDFYEYQGGYWEEREGRLKAAGQL